jgi:hypothetical protein
VPCDVSLVARLPRRPVCWRRGEGPAASLGVATRSLEERAFAPTVGRAMVSVVPSAVRAGWVAGRENSETGKTRTATWFLRGPSAKR